ncbi:uncharacterized protein LOC111519760 [Drosophila willistoni]|uniref:uncharacterized protein LOC111519760 n=1 Tax=Drosophila willistoni TaxID=7260 RepID=UPI001F072C9A|nr:uncharacterized protein LOC111519760 [Drosophila willistoni]
MIFTSPILLFIYNSMLLHLIRCGSDALEASVNVEGIGDLQVPILLGDYLKNIWVENLIINTFILIPAFIQHRYFSFPLAFLLTWNFFIFQCVLAYVVTLLWMLWWSSLSTFYYMSLGSIGILLNVIHFVLIIDTMGLQTVLQENKVNAEEHREDSMETS